MRQTWNFDDHIGSLNDEIGLLAASHFGVYSVDVPQATLARTLPL